MNKKNGCARGHGEWFHTAVWRIPLNNRNSESQSAQAARPQRCGDKAVAMNALTAGAFDKRCHRGDCEFHCSGTAWCPLALAGRDGCRCHCVYSICLLTLSILELPLAPFPPSLHPCRNTLEPEARMHAHTYHIHAHKHAQTLSQNCSHAFTFSV